MKFLDKIRIGIYHAAYHRNLKKADQARHSYNIQKFKKYVYRSEDAWRKLVIIQTKYTQNIEKVKELQRALITLGYDLGPYGPLGDGEDGKFGPYTEDAVKMFQQDYFNDKEKWTGIVNSETNKKYKIY